MSKNHVDMQDFTSLCASCAPADAAGGEEEPVHEDPGAVVVGVIGQEAVPLVALLARAVPGAARGALLPADNKAQN